MSTDARHPDDRRALTPEERALADRLARLGPQVEPSPALDARILAAARAAAVAPASGGPAHTPRRRTHRRWPVALGTAATLAIVGGLAWQLRPVDEVHVAYSEAPRAVSGPSADAAPAARAQPAPHDAANAAAATTQAAEDAMQPAPAPSAPAQDEQEREQAVDDAPGPEAFPAPAPVPHEPPVVFDEPSPMDTPSPPAAPPPAPPPPPAPVAPAPAAPSPVVARPQAAGSATAPVLHRAAGPETAAARAREIPATHRPKVATGTSAQPARPASAAEAADASALDRIEVTGSRIDASDAADVTFTVDQPLDDQPPASADSPQVRQAWLQRVRELLAEGKQDAARDSLREYQRRYPHADLPEDLRALLAQ